MGDAVWVRPIAALGPAMLAGCLPLLPDLADPCVAWDDPGLYRVKIEQPDDRNRKPYVFVPSAEGPRDIVVLLHGGGMSGPKMEEATGFEDLAERDGFVLVYPNGLGWPIRVWNSGQTGKGDDHDDVAFLDRLIAQVSPAVCGNRVLATGFSNGSMMAQRWACEGKRPPDGVSGSGGPLLLDHCEGDPVPLRYYHGTDDPVVRYDGGPVRGFTIPPVEEAMAVWKENNHCADTDGEPTRRGDTTCVQFNCEVSTVQCTVEGWRHQWPGGIHSQRTEANATGAIWSWFDNQVPHPTDDPG